MLHSRITNGKDQLDGEEKSTCSTRHSRISIRRPTWEGDSDESEDDEEESLMEKSGLFKLDISENEFMSLPFALPCLAPNLSKLVASGNHITDVSSVTCLPASLSLLDLSKNSMTKFDLSGRQGVSDRACYSVSHGSISRRASFPLDVNNSGSNRRLCRHRAHKSLAHLRQLILSGNKLDELHLTVRRNVRSPSVTEIIMPALQSLDLSNNLLKEVPQQIGKHVKLGSLNIADNPKIDSLPPELGLCADVYELKFNNQQLKFPPRNVLDRRGQDNRPNVRYIIGFLKSVYEK